MELSRLESLGLPEEDRPDAEMLGHDSNAFNLVGIAIQALKHEGFHDSANELNVSYWDCDSYGQLLTLLQRYVNIV